LSAIGKTVCAVGRAQQPPEFVATMRDRDTESCRTFPSGTSALASAIRYPEQGWARPMRLPSFAAAH
jgi:hypothetical protein